MTTEVFCNYIFEVDLESMDFDFMRGKIDPLPGYLEVWWGQLTSDEVETLKEKEWVLTIQKAEGFDIPTSDDALKKDD